ncbi:MAG: transposase family protein, partial [Planctomycetales bacterium]|nr:transposase family protein [Planctomycetales bacterium]
EISQTMILVWLGIWSSTFAKWVRYYGKAFEHNGWIPRDHWLEDWEKQAIIKFHFDNPLNGYRRLTYMMLDANIVAVSAASVYRVLSDAGLLGRSPKATKKGTGFHQPVRPHAHWHVDIAYLNICGTFYFIASVLDGYSRSVVHWDIREKMEEADIEIILEVAKEKYPEARPRIITDNGPQFIARDFKEFVRISGMTHVRTSPYYPQSNGKIERYHKTLKGECIRPQTPLTPDDAKRIVAKFVTEYNEIRLHSALGYVTPKDMLEGRQEEIFRERDAKLEAARMKRAAARQRSRQATEENPTYAETMSYSDLLTSRTLFRTRVGG